MARNGIQFQKGLSLVELQRLYGCEEQCEAALEKARWPDGLMASAVPVATNRNTAWSTGGGTSVISADPAGIRAVTSLALAFCASYCRFRAAAATGSASTDAVKVV